MAVVNLNLGCGDNLLDGWVNLDREWHGQPANNVVDVLDAGLPFADGAIDFVYANHFLQAFAWADLENVTAEIARVLRVGGVFLALVPDVVQAFQQYEARNENWHGFRAIAEPWSIDRKFAHYLTWGGTNLTCFTPESLCELLERHDLKPRPVTLAQDRASLPESYPHLRRPFESLMMESTLV